MATFFTSDTHFYHKNIIDYCDRPYRTQDGQPDVPAMNEDMIARWNARVGVDDVVYHLGDFGFGNEKRLAEVRKRLNGKLILVRGNHDHKLRKWLLPGDEVHDSLTVGRVFMAHIPPIDNVPANNYGLPHIVPPKDATIILCGHVHDLWQNAGYISEGRVRTIYNVGVDVWGMQPITLDDLMGVREAWENK